jgi:hypothetical protein
LKKGIIEGDNPVRDPEFAAYDIRSKSNDIHGTTDFGSRGGKATARRLLAGADERARVPKR